jgi:hypothetical protein
VERGRKLLFNGYGVSVWDFYYLKEILEIHGGDGYTTIKTYLMPLNCTSKEYYNGKFHMHIYQFPGGSDVLNSTLSML